MLKNENIICISSIDWDFIWQGHQEIMSTFAENGNRVLFIENTGVRSPGVRDLGRIRSRIKNWLKGIKGIRKESDNLYIFSPIVLPFPYFRLGRWINRFLIMSVLRRWMKVMDFTDPVVWTFLPTPLSLDIADSLINKVLIYYCIDNFAVTSPSAIRVKRSEKKLFKISDMVFVTSKELYDYGAEYNPKIYKFPFGVNFEKFREVREKDSGIPEELINIKKPIIGYVGGVHRCVDMDLLKEAANTYPDYSFVFVGPVQTNVTDLSSFKNVYFLGKKEHEKLPFFIKYFDACVIPYLIDDYTRNVYPTKLNEYLSMGKPVISTALPEVEGFNREYGNVVYIAEDRENFIGLINKAVNEKEEGVNNKRIKISEENSWESRIEKMSGLIEKEIELKKKDIESKWKENLVIFYRTARRRTLKLAVLGLVIYMLFFKTPFIWLAAEPLKISQMPVKTDAIVVFGGGVGETGSPGKSTIERARYAVKLYKEGYADKIIFSSGYTYIYNDAENMKLFAVSMGIPEKNIILEQKANSAYENVLFSKEILDENDWNSALVVSSPYNTRRVALVFDKIAPDKKVFYAPVENPQFYDKDKGRRIEQIYAVSHEYLGIVYYWFKKYL